MTNEEIQKEYFSWNPAADPEFAPQIIGKGTIGGKGRSLLYALRKLRDSGDDTLAATRVLDSIYLSVDLFYQFIEKVSSLDSLIASGDPERLENAFLSTPLPQITTDALRGFLVNVRGPIVVRSSCKLEDSIKHSFAGKYRSTFLINTSPSLDERMKDAEDEIRRIYARIWFPKALDYRAKHSLGEDAMGIIVIRMAGTQRGRYYYPSVAGVGYSQNFRRWTTRIKQEDGLLRLVFGLGTMSTKRGYARTISLTNPYLRPDGQNPDKIARNAQEKFHVIDSDNPDGITTLDIQKHWKQLLKFHPDYSAYAQIYNYDPEGGYLSQLLKNTACLEPNSKICLTFEEFPRMYNGFLTRMKKTLNFLEESMGVPADIEFAYEPAEDDLCLIQSRPFWYNTSGSDGIPDLDGRRIIMRADRMITAGSAENIGAIVYIDHKAYYSSPDFYKVARGVGKVNKQLAGQKYILVSPGRVGSSNPSLGVPIQYDELTNCSCIVELGIPRLGFMPELSYGTHFFSDLAVDNVLYMPIFDGEMNNLFDHEWFDDTKYEEGPHPAIRIYRGSFSAYMDGENNKAVIVDNAK